MKPALLQTRFLLVCPALNDIMKLINLLPSSHFSILTENTDSFLGYMMFACSQLSTPLTYWRNKRLTDIYSHKIFAPGCWKSPWMLLVEVLPYSLDHMSKVPFPFKF